MATLSNKDLCALDTFLRALYRCRRIERFASVLLQELPKLVGSDQTTWNTIAVATGEVRVMANPEEREHLSRQDALNRHIAEHPLLQHYWRSGDPRPVKVSDFLSEKHFHATALYDELYQPLGYEDHFAMHLTPPGPRDYVVVLGRGRRSFRERDRMLLDLIRPHIAQAYRMLSTLHRLRRRLDAHLAIAPRQARLELARDGRILHCPARAQRWIYEYFDDLPRSPQALPASLQQWLHAVHRDAPIPPPPMLRDRGHRQLLFYADQPDPDAESIMLYLEERTTPGAARRLRALGLSPRETEVLLQVERGLTNHEIAAVLGVSDSTIKRHLEHIFEKLGVNTRTAALARLRHHRDSPLA